MLKQRNFLKLTASIAVVVAVIVLAIWLGILAKENEFIQNAVLNYGYIGVFFLSIVSGFNIIVPIPIAAFFPLLIASGLNQWITILVVAVGTTVADTLSYLIGRIGRQLMSPRTEQTLERFEKMKSRARYLPFIFLFFFAAFVPLPNELLIIPLAFLGYHLKHLIPVVFLGSLIFNTLAMFGTLNLFELLQSI